MITKRVSYQSKQLGLGTYMLQGFVGGMLAGYLLLLIVLIERPNPYNFLVVFYAAITMTVGGGLGAIKAVLFWALNRFFGFPVWVLARILAGGFLPTSLVVFLLIREGSTDEQLFINASAFFLLSLPTSLLIASRIRPWEFFTFGSMVFRENGIFKRHTVTDSPVILGGLLLRLISTGAFLLSVLIVAIYQQWIGKSFFHDIMFYFFPVIYFALSGYLTFRSPRKSALLIIGLILNVPLMLPFYLGSRFLIDSGWQADDATALFIICAIFLAAWTAFIGTQLSVSSRRDLVADISHAAPGTSREQDPDHECLGSRFAEWQERLA